MFKLYFLLVSLCVTIFVELDYLFAIILWKRFEV